jgi:hypothetical protein
LAVRANAVHYHGGCASSIDQKQISAQVALRKPGPVATALCQQVFVERGRQRFPGDQQVENMSERVLVEFDMTLGDSIVPLEAREND